MQRHQVTTTRRGFFGDALRAACAAALAVGALLLVRRKPDPNCAARDLCGRCAMASRCPDAQPTRGGGA